MRAYAGKLYRSASSVLPLHHQQQEQPPLAGMDPIQDNSNAPIVAGAMSGEPRPHVDGDQQPSIDVLEMFRIHLGINARDDLHSRDIRPAPNMGIYQRVVQAEREAGRSYKLFAFMINGALGLQIIFAAALTALGAGGGSHIAVTAFGALNTVLAGFLTFLKGSGLPNRLKFYENEWAKVREYIEQRERDFAIQKHGLVTLDLGREITTIEQMYEHVRKDIEANTPDSYISLSRHMGGGAGRSSDSAPIPARQFQDDSAGGTIYSARKIAPSLARQYTDTVGKVQARFADLETSARARFADAEHDLEKRFADKRADVEQRVHGVQSQAQSRMQGYQADAEKRYADIQRGFQDTQGQAQSRVYDLESGLSQRYNDAQTAAQQGYQDTRSQAQRMQTQLESSRAGLKRQYTDTRTTVEHDLSSATEQARSNLHDAEIAAQNRILETRYAAEQELRETQKQVESQILATQSAADAQIAEQTKQATSKAQEIEEKVLGAAEMVAGKILEFTSHRHDKDKDKA